MRKGLGEEDISHKAFASLVRRYERIGKLNSPWWSYDASGEYRNAKTGALLKAKGLRPGKADFEFKTIRNNITHHIYLEFKTKTGRQSPNQKLFENTCFAENEKYFLVRSVQEAINILINENIIIDESISN